MAKSTKVAVVAVESSLIGRTIIPRYNRETDPHGGAAHLWPWARMEKGVVDYREESAEIVAVFVGDLGDGGKVKVLALGLVTGESHELYSSLFLIPRTV